MGTLWGKNNIYLFLRHYVDWCTRWSYRRIRIEGKENIPQDAPVIYASNHCCTLMDPLVILLSSHQPTASGARADIFRKPKIYAILHWLRMVPLARERDGKSAVASNHDTFEEIAECIGHRVPFGIFVEGTHHPDRGLLPIHKGVFKIAAVAEEKLGENVSIVPVGLAYEKFFTYMTDVTMRFGEPIVMAEHPGENLTELLTQRMLGLIEPYPVSKTYPLWASIPLSIISLPIFIVAAVLAAPMVIATLIFSRKFKDYAWINTVRFCSKLALLPILMIIWGVLMFIFAPWWAAVITLIALIFSHSVFYLLYNFYKKTIHSIKK